MKYVKVRVTKAIGKGRLQWAYPDGYDRNLIAIEIYEHSGDPSKGQTDEFLYGMADDAFTQADGVAVMDKTEYGAVVKAIKDAAAILAAG